MILQPTYGLSTTQGHGCKIDSVQCFLIAPKPNRCSCQHCCCAAVLTLRSSRPDYAIGAAVSATKPARQPWLCASRSVVAELLPHPCRCGSLPPDRTPLLLLLLLPHHSSRHACTGPGCVTAALLLLPLRPCRCGSLPPGRTLPPCRRSAPWALTQHT